MFLLIVLLLRAYLELGGFFKWIAARIVRYAHAPASLLAVVVVVSGVLSVTSGFRLAPDGDELDLRRNLTLIGSMANLIDAERASARESEMASSTM